MRLPRPRVVPISHWKNRYAHTHHRSGPRLWIIVCAAAVAGNNFTWGAEIPTATAAAALRRAPPTIKSARGVTSPGQYWSGGGAGRSAAGPIAEPGDPFPLRAGGGPRVPFPNAAAAGRRTGLVSRQSAVRSRVVTCCWAILLVRVSLVATVAIRVVSVRVAPIRFDFRATVRTYRFEASAVRVVCVQFYPRGRCSRINSAVR